MLRRKERVIHWPHVKPTHPEYKTGEVRPGQFLSVMDPQIVRTQSGLYVPEIARDLVGGSFHAMRYLRPDAATVLKLGPIPDKKHPLHALAVKMHEELTVGDHVLMVPYVNRFENLAGVPDAHIAGLDGDEWLDTTIAKEIDGGWKMLGNWVLLRLHWTLGPVPANYNGRPRRLFEDWGTVIACGMDSQFEAGEQILLEGKGEHREYDCKFFVAPHSPWGDDVVMFREASYQMGINRRIEFAGRVGARV